MHTNNDIQYEIMYVLYIYKKFDKLINRNEFLRNYYTLVI